MARIISTELAERLEHSPQEANEWMTGGDETVHLGWAWEGVMFCLSGTKFVTDAVESQVVFGSHTLETKSRAEPRLVVGPAVAAIRDAFARTDRARISTHLFVPEEWNEDEIYPALMVPDFWSEEHLRTLLAQWDQFAALYDRAAQCQGALLLWWVDPARNNA